MLDAEVREEIDSTGESRGTHGAHEEGLEGGGLLRGERLAVLLIVI